MAADRIFNAGRQFGIKQILGVVAAVLGLEVVQARLWAHLDQGQFAVRQHADGQLAAAYEGLRQQHRAAGQQFGQSALHLLLGLAHAQIHAAAFVAGLQHQRRLQDHAVARSDHL